jgi:hypothetical protein
MSDAPSSASWRPWILAACALGLARFYRLGDWSLWYDEAVTVADGWHGEGGPNPFGYWLVHACAELLGGPEPFALRLPAAVFGWLAIPLTWWAFRPLCGDRRASLAALLVAASSWALYWSQNARFYTMAQAVGLVGTGVFLRGIIRGCQLRTVLGVAVVGLGAGFHPTAALLAAALVGAAWLARLEGSSRRVAGRLVLVGVVSALAASPWALSAFRNFVAAKDTAGLSSVAHLAKSTGFLLTPTLAVGMLVGGLAAWRESPQGRMLCLIPILGGAASAVAAFFAASSAQYVFVLLPAMAVLAAWPFENAGRSVRLAWALVLAAPLATGSWLYFSVRHGERPRWEEAYRFVWDQRGERDLILGMQASVGEYYLVPGATDLRRPTAVAWVDRTNSHAWKRWAKRERPLWVVVRPDFLQLWDPAERAAFEGFLYGECRLVRRFPVRMEARDLDVEVWRRP